MLITVYFFKHHILFYPINTEDKQHLIRLLNPTAYNWRQLGEALRVTYGDVKSIFNKRYDDANNLSEALQLWFDKQPSEEVIWYTLITAVELAPSNNFSMADDIRKFFPTEVIDIILVL